MYTCEARPTYTFSEPYSLLTYTPFPIIAHPGGVRRQRAGARRTHQDIWATVLLPPPSTPLQHAYSISLHLVTQH